MFAVLQQDTDREVTSEEGENFAKTHGCLFVETSAKADVAVTQAFEELVLKVCDTCCQCEHVCLNGAWPLSNGAWPWSKSQPMRCPDHHCICPQVLETPNLLTDAGNSRLHVGAGIQQPPSSCCG
jgi:Ras family